MTQTPTSYASLVATEIRSEMARQRKKPAELAKLLGCSPATANNRLAGSYAYNLDELITVCLWLDKPIGDITGAAAEEWRAAS